MCSTAEKGFVQNFISSAKFTSGKRVEKTECYVTVSILIQIYFLFCVGMIGYNNPRLKAH